MFHNKQKSDKVIQHNKSRTFAIAEWSTHITTLYGAIRIYDELLVTTGIFSIEIWIINKKTANVE